MKAKSYKLKYTPTEEQLIASGAKRGGIWIDEESVFYITKCFELPKYNFEFSIDICFKDDISDWNDFDNVLVLDEDLLQPYTPFYGKNYKKEISNHPCLEYCIEKYNEFMDGLDFLCEVSELTNEEAMKILHPNTTLTALAEVEYYGGFNGQEAKIKAVEEACLLACKALEKQIPKKPRETRCALMCSSCGHKITEKGCKKLNRLYCKKCGQAIDWSDDE